MPPCHANNECNSPDVMVIGFQEIVPLTAQQIVQTDPEKKCCCSFSYVESRTDPLLTDVYGRTKSLKHSNEGQIKSVNISFCAASRYFIMQSFVVRAYNVVFLVSWHCVGRSRKV